MLLPYCGYYSEYRDNYLIYTHRRSPILCDVNQILNGFAQNATKYKPMKSRYSCPLKQSFTLARYKLHREKIFLDSPFRYSGMSLPNRSFRETCKLECIDKVKMAVYVQLIVFWICIYACLCTEGNVNLVLL